MLFDVGDQNTPFFVVLSGAIDIVRLIGNREEPLVVHREGQFTGEINMLSSRRSLARARMASDGAVIAVDRDDLRRLVQRDSELSEILMRAFMLRRLEMMGERETQDMVLLGSRHSGDARIREFLTRNGQPYAYLDVGTTEVQAPLDDFTSGSPISLWSCAGAAVLRKPSIWSRLANASASTPSSMTRRCATS